MPAKRFFFIPFRGLLPHPAGRLSSICSMPPQPLFPTFSLQVSLFPRYTGVSITRHARIAQHNRCARSPERVYTVTSQRLFGGRAAHSGRVVSRRPPSLSRTIYQSVAPTSKRFQQLRIAAQCPQIHARMQKIDGTGMLQSGGHLTEVSMQFGLVKHRTLPGRKHHPILGRQCVHAPRVRYILFQMLLPMKFHRHAILLVCHVKPCQSRPQIDRMVRLRIRQSPFHRIQTQLPFPPGIGVRTRQTQRPACGLAAIDLPLIKEIHQFLFGRAPQPLVTACQPIRQYDCFLEPVEPHELGERRGG